MASPVLRSSCGSEVFDEDESVVVVWAATGRWTQPNAVTAIRATATIAIQRSRRDGRDGRRTASVIVVRWSGRARPDQGRRRRRARSAGATAAVGEARASPGAGWLRLQEP